MKLSTRKYFFLISAVLFLIILLNYANSLHSPFHYDDDVVVTYDRSIKNINNYFQLNRIAHRHTLHLTYSLNYYWGKMNPFGYHLVNILLHYLTSITIFIITFITLEKGVLWRREAALKIAFITTLLFALNPVHTETVTYISGRSSGLASLLYFLSLLLFIIGSFKNIRIKVPRQLLYLFSFATGFMALTSKEISVTLPAIVILYDLFFMRTESWVKFRTRLLYYYLPLPILAATVLTKYLSPLLSMMESFLLKSDILNALGQFKIVNYVLKLYFFPINLSFDYHFPDFFHLKELSFLPVIVIFLFVLLYALKRIYKINPLLSFSILWYLITISPTNSVLPRAELFNDRNLYLPSFGLSLFFAIVFFFFFKYFRNYSIRFFLILCSLMVILSLNSALLIKRNNIYKSEISLWEDTLKKSPHDMRAITVVGKAYLLNDNDEKALKRINQLMVLNPHAYKIHDRFRNIYRYDKERGRAENEFQESIKVDPNSTEAYFVPLNDIINAVNEFNKSNKANPVTVNTLLFYMNIIKACVSANLLVDAEKKLKRFILLFPNVSEAHLLLANIYSKKGNYDLAIEQYKKSLENKFFGATIHNNIGLIFIRQNKFDEAIEELEKAILINPVLLEAQFNLGRLFLERKNNKKKARIYFLRALALGPKPQNAQMIRDLLDRL